MAAARGLDYSKWDKLEVPDEAEDDTCGSQPAGKSNSNATLCRNCRMVPQKQLMMMILFNCSLLETTRMCSIQGRHLLCSKDCQVNKAHRQTGRLGVKPVIETLHDMTLQFSVH